MNQASDGVVKQCREKNHVPIVLVLDLVDFVSRAYSTSVTAATAMAQRRFSIHFRWGWSVQYTFDGVEVFNRN